MLTPKVWIWGDIKPLFKVKFIVKVHDDGIRSIKIIPFVVISFTVGAIDIESSTNSLLMLNWMNTMSAVLGNAHLKVHCYSWQRQHGADMLLPMSLFPGMKKCQHVSTTMLNDVRKSEKSFSSFFPYKLYESSEKKYLHSNEKLLKHFSCC